MEVLHGSDKELHNFEGHREAVVSKPANVQPQIHQIFSTKSYLRNDYLFHMEEQFRTGHF